MQIRARFICQASSDPRFARLKIALRPFVITYSGHRIQVRLQLCLGWSGEISPFPKRQLPKASTWLTGTTYVVAPQQIHCLIDFREIGVGVHNGADELIAEHMMSSPPQMRQSRKNLRRILSPVKIVGHYVEPVDVLFDCYNVKILHIPVAWRNRDSEPILVAAWSQHTPKVCEEWDVIRIVLRASGAIRSDWVLPDLMNQSLSI